MAKGRRPGRKCAPNESNNNNNNNSTHCVTVWPTVAPFSQTRGPPVPGPLLLQNSGRGPPGRLAPARTLGGVRGGARTPSPVTMPYYLMSLKIPIKISLRYRPFRYGYGVPDRGPPYKDPWTPCSSTSPAQNHRSRTPCPHQLELPVGCRGATDPLTRYDAIPPSFFLN